MSFNLFIRLFTVLLAINFGMQLMVSVSHPEMAHLEIDLDGDSEEKESKKERDTDKLNHGQINSSFRYSLLNSSNAIHYNHWWVTPVIETNDPPPEVA